MKNKNILVVDDEKNLRETLAELFTGEGYAVATAGDGAEALLKVRAAKFACVFLDIRMPRMDGLQLLAKLREENLIETPIVVISAFGESSQTIEAIRLGAFDYITKPLDIEELLQALKRAIAQYEQTQAARSEKGTVSASPAISEKAEIIGASPAIREVFKQIGRVAATNATVLVTGESGTGKELVARAIHEHSARSAGPFIAVNCGALPENLVESELFGYEKGAFTGAAGQKRGSFEAADKGTIFLDEIGELPLGAQVKLLRVLQEKSIQRVGGTNPVPIDARVIAATNRDLRTEIALKTFREDLFYRLNVVSIDLPPLRDRVTDIPVLAAFFLNKATGRNHLPVKTLSNAALQILAERDFPGNVRELENVIERAAVASGNSSLVLPEHFSAETVAPTTKDSHRDLLGLPFKEAVASLERSLIEKALRDSGGNRSEAARVLNINRRLLYDKIEEHKLNNED
jgi:two-component system response regulator AtoC